MDTAKPQTICPGCSLPFTAHHGRQAFHSTACQVSFHNVMKARGQALLPLALVWRKSKHGMTEDRRFAMAELCRLLDGFAAEDRAAGRRPDLIVRAKRLGNWTAADLLNRH